MSIKVMTAVWERSAARGTDLLMLLALADYSDDDGNSYPAVSTLADKCRMQARNANYILRALQASGELELRQNEGPKGTNRYRIVLSALGKGVQRFAGGRVQDVAGGMQGAAPCNPASAPLQSGAPNPAMECAKPLHPIADEPSLNRQEPSLNRQGDARARASRTCPDSFVVTSDLKAWAQAERPDINIERETAIFRNHEFARPYRDWPKVWKNWVLRAHGNTATPRQSATLTGPRRDFTAVDYRDGLTDGKLGSGVIQ